MFVCVCVCVSVCVVCVWCVWCVCEFVLNLSLFIGHAGPTQPSPSPCMAPNILTRCSVHSGQSGVGNPLTTSGRQAHISPLGLELTNTKRLPGWARWEASSPPALSQRPSCLSLGVRAGETHYLGTWAAHHMPMSWSLPFSFTLWAMQAPHSPALAPAWPPAFFDDVAECTLVNPGSEIPLPPAGGRPISPPLALG